ncbi:hypothetical protein ACJIZ3_009036 [Penstemon smallii]|uniref:Uncharacterized protein n=1 Tax=Penstemon smallii TaxID=265156 RepID=A0ABD3TC77_9LAMI
MYNLEQWQCQGDWSVEDERAFVELFISATMNDRIEWGRNNRDPFIVLSAAFTHKVGGEHTFAMCLLKQSYYTNATLYMSQSYRYLQARGAKDLFDFLDNNEDGEGHTHDNGGVVTVSYLMVCVQEVAPPTSNDVNDNVDVEDVLLHEGDDLSHAVAIIDLT